MRHIIRYTCFDHVKLYDLEQDFLLQVAWLEKENETWELASTLPESLVQEYENDILPAESTLSEMKYGTISHMVIFGENNSAAEPPAKKKKGCIEWDKGYDKMYIAKPYNCHNNIINNIPIIHS